MVYKELQKIFHGVGNPQCLCRSTTYLFSQPYSKRRKGIGTFALEMAKYCSDVEAVENEEENVKLANLTTKLNGIKFKVRKERVEKAGKLFADKIVVDPLRAGLSKKVIGKILDSNAKKIVYVSCNPETQKRDLDLFLEKGWVVEHSLLVHQFLNTEHLETIISLKRK